MDRSFLSNIAYGTHFGSDEKACIEEWKAFKNFFNLTVLVSRSVESCIDNFLKRKPDGLTLSFKDLTLLRSRFRKLCKSKQFQFTKSIIEYSNMEAGQDVVHLLNFLSKNINVNN